MTGSRNRQIGIMVCERKGSPPFSDRQFYRKLCLYGAKQKLKVFVFSLERVHWDSDTVDGYSFDGRRQQWSRRRFPLPGLIYDRCFYSSRPQYIAYRRKMRLLLQRGGIRFLGYGLRGKWEVQQLMERSDSLRAHLPRTELLADADAALHWLQQEGELFMKPQAGSHGKGAYHIRQTGMERYAVRGRDSLNRLIFRDVPSRDRLRRWIARLASARKYVAQQYLSLIDRTGCAYDIRSLVQKNASGQWSQTGIAVRLGQPGSVTSNLHGGGSAQHAQPFLEAQFGSGQALRIVETVQRLSREIPPLLEQSHGRLLELGIDFGVDRVGRVWILEVNSKPGRSVFKQLSDAKASAISVASPIHYACYLLDTNLGG